ncbi:MULTISPECIES: DUF554 domain-containing protein [Thermoanaerobacter]|jgi:uncharacterized membrane protein YqgA involved in biofilm formation|uniref:Transport protein n=2 Tax=Thermoanaerobacter TaxID=1754 RepID=B0KBR9_THEP3|nr:MULTISPECIES: DUF554 domain-containing protein [Thermoanaerobacter]KUJ90303.1 MAG: hypothetical protein XD37_1479 [Thermoanaerobacter thermocopriae]ABY95364.1 protein of unknown function DUF554 [Thermoanaerobacter pseudethanolicus ATCC 33223]ADV80307.1 protein of unknown function DUF554 [Thermoanaerobacter brockii subsp. finnii Ako-1]MDI3501485.1 uncharacterized protein [Thermoanaerobacter sp.]HAA81362.1 DUF554 domain-containing protein [Thermoanaerobacter sp.]
MLGTIVNSIAIIVGGTIGTLLKVGIPERFKNIVMQGVALSVMIIGISSGLQFNNLMVVIVSLVIGGIIGEALNIEEYLNKLGDTFQKKLSKDNSSTISKGFVTASLVYCIGAMAIVGALKDGLSGDHSILFAKSVLDGISSIIFASTFGLGVVFSAISVFLYQGSISLGASFLQGLLTKPVIDDMTAVGGVLIFAISLNMLEIKNIKVGNLLPAIFIPIFYQILLNIIKGF